MLVIDDFLDNYQVLKTHSLHCDFVDVVNDIDGVTYRDICLDIPIGVKSEITRRLSQHVGHDIIDPIMFMRMSKQGVEVPHPVHHDLSHGQYSCMIYLNDHDFGGTSLVRHIETGIAYAPGDDQLVQRITDDMGDLSKWVVYEHASMKQNTCAIFQAGFMHMAQPFGGFGTTQNDARIVLTCFFS